MTGGLGLTPANLLITAATSGWVLGRNLFEQRSLDLKYYERDFIIWSA